MIAGSRDAGPIVATIFVRFRTTGSMGPLPCACNSRLLRRVKRM